MNKASGSDGIAGELFKILKDECCESAALSMSANLENSAVAAGLEKVQFSFPSLGKAIPKNAQTT